MNDVERQELSLPGGNQLQVAIDALYVAFQTPKPLSIEGCSCCLNKDDAGMLLTRKLREITPEELAPYASSVLKEKP
jgi:hypothetical protein